MAKNLFIILISILGICLPTHAQSLMYKSHEKITFSYEEFRSLSKVKQRAWLSALRDFNRKMDLINAGQRLDTRKPKFWSFLDSMQLKTSSPLCAFAEVALSPSFAAAAQITQVTCTVAKKTTEGREEICLSCPGSQQVATNICAEDSGNATKTGQNIFDIVRLSEMSSLGQRTYGFSEEDVKKYVEEAMKNGSADFKVSVVQKKGPEELKIKSLGDTGVLKRNDNLDVEEITAVKDNACIYAGWAIQTKGPCKPISEKELIDTEGNRTLFSCKKPTSVNEIKVLSGNEEDAIVLCNPILFGLENDRPICIRPAKNATEECKRRSNEIAETHALTLAMNNPAEYRSLNTRFTQLCQSSEEALDAHFRSRGKNKTQARNAVKDVSQTCVHLREKMAELTSANESSKKAIR